MKNLLSTIAILAATSAIVVPAYIELQELSDLRVEALKVVAYEQAEQEIRSELVAREKAIITVCNKERQYAENLLHDAKRYYRFDMYDNYQSTINQFDIITDWIINNCN